MITNRGEGGSIKPNAAPPLFAQSAIAGGSSLSPPATSVFEGMAEEVTFFPKIENLQKFKEFCKKNRVTMLVLCANIPKNVEPMLSEFIKENDIMSDEEDFI